MNADWLSYLIARGAYIHANRVQHFGDPSTELVATASGIILADLSHLGLLELAGEDSSTFLQGQVTNDVRLLDGAHSQYAGYCTAKGRLLATLLLWKHGDSHYAQLDDNIAAPVMKRLKMYILRSKVSIADAGDALVRLGVAGNGCEEVLAEIFPAIPQQPHLIVADENTVLMRIPGIAPRFEIIAKPENAPLLWERLERHCKIAGAPCWEWLDIHAGIPSVTLATQEEFIPQSLNIDLLDGISFQKGCYTGQEIVARTHHLGKVKRRTQLAHIAADLPPQAGDDVFGTGAAEPVGEIINTASATQGGYDVLFEVRLESLAAGALYWKIPGGPALESVPLPYSI